GTELAERLQHAISRPCLGPLCGDERAADQGVDDVDGLAFHLGSERLNGADIEPAAAYRQAVEEVSLRRRQQVVAPSDRGAHRLMAVAFVAPRTAQQTESIVESRDQLCGLKRSDACGSELEREWHTIEADAELTDGIGVVGVDHEAGLRYLRALDE